MSYNQCRWPVIFLAPAALFVFSRPRPSGERTNSGRLAASRRRHDCSPRPTIRRRRRPANGRRACARHWVWPIASHHAIYCSAAVPPARPGPPPPEVSDAAPTCCQHNGPASSSSSSAMHNVVVLVRRQHPSRRPIGLAKHNCPRRPVCALVGPHYRRRHALEGRK